MLSRRSVEIGLVRSVQKRVIKVAAYLDALVRKAMQDGSRREGAVPRASCLI